MKKQAPIVQGSKVYWLKKILPDMAWVAKLDAIVAEIPAHLDGLAEIDVKTDSVYGAPTQRFTVPISELENKAWIEDQDAIARIRQGNIDSCEAVESWDGLFVEFGGDQYFDSVTRYLEYCGDQEIEPAEWLQCVALNPYSLDSESIVDRIADELGEVVADHLTGLEELDAALQAFVDANHLQSCDEVGKKIKVVNK